jgi:hypothetical protein
MNAAEIIAQAIAYEESERAAAPAEDQHYWADWDAELVRAGRPVVYATSQCPGTGHRARFVLQVMVELPDGKGYVGAGPDIHVEHVPTQIASRRNGLGGYAARLAVKLYGKGLPLVYKHHV